MKKFALVVILCLLVNVVSQASEVDSISAKNVAINFYNSNNNSNKLITNIKLVYTEMAEDSTPAYYVFSVNTEDGFVIVSADDLAQPVLGYSTTGNYIKSNISPAMNSWMSDYKLQISEMKKDEIETSPEITFKWQYYLTPNEKSGKNKTNCVEPLLTTKWDQSPYYNALCPVESVTGCVATSMAQVMKHWNHPTKGNGLHSYCNCTSNNFQNDYGTITANFDTTIYNWSNMPDELTAPNDDVALLMFHCGVSVDMDYGASKSSASFNSAAKALIEYFGYNPATLRYITRDTSDTEWMITLKTELDNNRPIIYNLNGIHAWVCDGYDDNNFLHMNWGWGGSGDGYYALTDTIQITNGWKFWGSKRAYGAIIGIQPLNTTGFQPILSLPQKLSLYPNPAANKLTLKSSAIKSYKEVNISVINMYGEKLINEDTEWINNNSININNLPSGIYFVQVTNDSGKWTGKFIKE